jgi:hypothetical protein
MLVGALINILQNMKANFVKYTSGMLLLGGLATARAQSTWNYFISDAGGGNSLVTWNVTGSLATPPGSVRMISGSSLTVSINAPGIYADSYAASGTPQLIPTVDGSYFQYDNTSVYTPVVTYSAFNAPGSGNDSFGFSALLSPRDIGVLFLYHPGTQSALIPIDFSDFNPGTYQSEQSGFDTALTVNLTVTAVPEPSALALSLLSGLGTLLLVRRRK